MLEVETLCTVAIHTEADSFTSVEGSFLYNLLTCTEMGIFLTVRLVHMMHLANGPCEQN